MTTGEDVGCSIINPGIEGSAIVEKTLRRLTLPSQFSIHPLQCRGKSLGE